MIPSRAPDLDATVHACMSRGIRRIQVLEWRDLADSAAGGAEKHVHEVVRRWAEAGLAIDIRTVEVPGEPAVIERDGYRVERLGGHHTGVLRAAAAGATRLRKGTDAVYESWIGIPFWTPLWFRGPQLAFLYHLHDDLWESHFPGPLAKVGSLLEARLAPLAYRKVSIATLSRSSAAELKERTLFKPQQITIVPPGIGDEFRTTAPRSQAPLAVAAGRLVQAKRFDAVIDAFADVATAIPGARLVVVGEGPERGALEAQVASLGLESVVELPGWVDDSTLVDIFSSAWLLVAASISEGWGMTITEAAACGTGAVASDIVGHGDALHYSSGHLVADDAELAARMKEVLSDRQLADAMGVEARAASAALDWDTTAASLLELLVQDAERRG